MPEAAEQLRLNLTDFLDLGTLREVQERFTALTRLQTVIRDADGNVLAAPTDPADLESERILEHLIADQDIDPEQPLVAPILVEGQQLGTIAIELQESSQLEASRENLRRLALDFGIPRAKVESFVDEVERVAAPNLTAAVRFLYLMANSIAQRCYDEHNLRRRVEELGTLYRISTLMASARDLKELLETAARSAAQVMNCKAASIRLLDDAGVELVLRATYGLSEQYLNKGPILVTTSNLFQETLAKGVTYVPDMTIDPRVMYPEDARREGLTSMLNVAMVYHGKPVGVIRLYTAAVRKFEPAEIELVRAVAQLVASAIESARMRAERAEAARVQRQLKLAGDVQRRMLPATPPSLPPFDLAARYVPTFDLGGDFYDFINLDGHLGVAVGDVVGKGIAAGLLMASVRASLRAYAQDVYDIDEIISRVNIAMTRDTLDNEFATVFYGVLDPQSLRLTYCNAGHEPALLLRRGKFQSLEVGGMIIGVDEHQQYTKSVVHLEPGDLLLIYSDGLTDAADFQNKRFGRERIRKAMLDAAKMNARQAADHILWEMRRFVGLNRSVDDLTLVTIKVGKPGRG